MFPCLCYCSEIWGNTCKTYLAPLVKLLKRAVRRINKTGFCDSAHPLFIKSNILKFDDFVKLIKSHPKKSHGGVQCSPIKCFKRRMCGKTSGPLH